MSFWLLQCRLLWYDVACGGSEIGFVRWSDAGEDEDEGQRMRRTKVEVGGPCVMSITSLSNNKEARGSERKIEACWSLRKVSQDLGGIAGMSFTEVPHEVGWTRGSRDAISMCMQCKSDG